MGAPHRRQPRRDGWTWPRGLLLGAAVLAIIAVLEALGLTDLGIGVGATFAVVFALAYTVVRIRRDGAGR